MVKNRGRMLFVKYETNQIEKYFNNFSMMTKKIGFELTKLTKKRYDQLKASRVFSVYLSTGLGKPHRLNNNLDGYYGIHLTANFRLIIKPNSESLKMSDLEMCDTVIIKGVEDYHGRKEGLLIP